MGDPKAGDIGRWLDRQIRIQEDRSAEFVHFIEEQGGSALCMGCASMITARAQGRLVKTPEGTKVRCFPCQRNLFK